MFVKSTPFLQDPIQIPCLSMEPSYIFTPNRDLALPVLVALIPWPELIGYIGTVEIFVFEWGICSSKVWCLGHFRYLLNMGWIYEWMGSYIYFIMVQNLSQNYQVELWVNRLRLINDSCLQMTLQFTAYSHIQTLIWPSHWPLWRLVRSARQMACMAWTRKYVIAWIINSAFLFQLLQHGLYLGGNWEYFCSASLLQSLFSLIQITEPGDVHCSVKCICSKQIILNIW